MVVVEWNEEQWTVLSLDSTSGRARQYTVKRNGYRWLCNCPHFLKNADDVNFVCKHIVAVLLKLGEVVEVEVRRNGKNGNRRSQTDDAGCLAVKYGTCDESCPQFGNCGFS
jgi:hypothetical protein